MLWLFIPISERKKEGLPEYAPQSVSSTNTYKCNLCVNECKLSPNTMSYCGLRSLSNGTTKAIPFPTKSRAYIHGYLDRNPTNCCNSWFCPAGTSNGFPEFSEYDGPEYTTYNYAAFMYGCTFDCLFCQNYSHKRISKSSLHEIDQIVETIVMNKSISCLCYFGGTPEAQLPFTINLAELVLDKIKLIDNKRKFRVCWEWNGSGNPELVKKCMEIAFKSGGNIKFDLKSFNEKLHIALTGQSNKRTLENFELLARYYFGTRKNLPELGACTLLVPGYVNEEEVELIAKFISKINKTIPYSLLVFHGDYQMRDLPITPKKLALKCLKTAKAYLKNVHLGNQFLL